MCREATAKTNRPQGHGISPALRANFSGNLQSSTQQRKRPKRIQRHGAVHRLARPGRACQRAPRTEESAAAHGGCVPRTQTDIQSRILYIRKATAQPPSEPERRGQRPYTRRPSSGTFRRHCASARKRTHSQRQKRKRQPAGNAALLSFHACPLIAFIILSTPRFVNFCAAGVIFSQFLPLRAAHFSDIIWNWRILAMAMRPWPKSIRR